MAGVLVLLAEYLVVAVRFDGGELVKRGGLAARLGDAGEIAIFVPVVATAGLLMSWRELGREARECARLLGSISWPFGLLHLLTFGCSLLALAGVYATSGSAGGRALAYSLLWLMFGVAALVALGRALFGPAVWGFTRLVVRVLLSGLLLGYAAWFIAMRSRPLWDHVAGFTLAASAWLLRLFTADVSVDAQRQLLSAHGLTVYIAPECSGVEGAALVSAFVGGYLFAFRSSLRVARCLLMVPLVAVVAWAANAARLAALVALGAYVSRDVAFGGFHSKAGWVLFCAIALGAVLLLQRTPFFLREGPTSIRETDNPTAGYCMPLLAVLAVSLVTGLFAAGVDIVYAPRVIAAVAALWAYRRYHSALGARPSLLAVLAGVVVFGLWLLLSPASDATAAPVAELRALVAAMSPAEATVWIIGRLAGAIVTMPIVEELAFRGFLQRRLVSSEFTDVPYQRLTPVAVAGSALAFGALHAAWLPGALAGAAYSLVAARRGQLIDAIVAHATTNALLAVCALALGRWDLWL